MLNSMSAIILDGRKTREAIIPILTEKVRKLSRVPTLAIIQVGDRPDSTSFIKAKKAFAVQIGVNEKHIHLSETILQVDLIKKIKECNGDDSIQGIILQLPLPEHLDKKVCIESIDPCKDADGITSYSLEQWNKNATNSIVIPATARGIRELLAHYNIALKDKKVTVVGRSELVGTPIAIMCEKEGAIVTVCDSKTKDLVSSTKDADIIIVAVGKPKLISSEHVKMGAVVIDVGITKDLEGVIVGDVDFDTVKDVASAISPVPGGVGPMTVCALFENLVDLSK